MTTRKRKFGPETEDAILAAWAMYPNRAHDFIGCACMNCGMQVYGHFTTMPTKVRYEAQVEAAIRKAVAVALEEA